MNFTAAGPPLVETHVGETEPISTAVTALVATLSDTRVDDLSPLYEAIDPDALNALVDRVDAAEVAFRYEGYGVCVTADGHVSVYADVADGGGARTRGARRASNAVADTHASDAVAKRRAEIGADGTVRDREALFQLLVESIDNYAIFMLDTDGHVISWNAGAERIKGYREEGILGEHFSTFYTDEDVDRGVPARNLNEARVHGRVEDEGWRVREDGSRFYANVTISAVRDDTGRLRGFAKVTRDMTAERHHQEVERQKERLEEFSNVVAHDLRSPLNVARAHLDLLDAEDDDRRETIERSLVRMEEIIDDLLALARRGLTVDSDAAVDLASVAGDAWAMVTGSNDTGDAALDIETGLELVADRGRLQELLENLLANAIEHGGGDVTVEIGDLAGEPGFYVEDDGPGIPADDREDVFEAGYSTAEDGTGFGLDIVERIAEAHGWEIRVTGGGEGGARFEITGVDVPTAR